MKQKIKTSFAFTKHLLTTGAMFETSKKVELEICKHITQNQKSIIVEFSMGYGNITKKILNKISENSIVYAFEVNKEFCDDVASIINDERLIIVNDDVSNMLNYINVEVDTFIGSIPFSFFSKKKSQQILSDSYNLLKNKGYYSQVLYTKHNFKKFQEIFDDCQMLKVSKGLPEYIYHCQKF